MHTTNPKPNLAFALPIVVRYRLFAQSPLNTKTFGNTQEERNNFQNFIESMRAKAVKQTYTTPSGATAERWVLVDKGQVDYMSIGFTDPEFEAKKQAKRQAVKAKIAAWRAGEI